MSRVRYQRDEKGTAQVMASRQMQDAMVNIVSQRYLPKARAISPVDSGNYSRSWGVDRGHRKLGARKPVNRAAAILYNTANYSGKVEQRHKVLHQIRAQIRQDNPEPGGG